MVMNVVLLRENEDSENTADCVLNVAETNTERTLLFFGATVLQIVPLNNDIFVKSVFLHYLTYT